MISAIPNATYRIQLREGVDFDVVARQLDYLSDLGISHLYLSPIFTATTGSTHGYDVIDPTEIDPVIGGRAGFEALAEAAHARGLGVILDIVPNHTAFVLENPWLSDVLRNGIASVYARHFDIDWEAGPLVLPMLAEPFEKMLAEDRFAAKNGFWTFDGVRVPLADGTRVQAETREELRALHEAQNWRLRHWEIERDGITHRRFFNVTSLIGMRVEDRKVFDDTHALIVDLVSSGLVDGLRVDHIDGLADPQTYLDWLAEVVPDIPVWVEKIVVGTETLPAAWQTAGTTGYEAARMIARLLTDEEGVNQLDTIWRDFTGTADDFPLALRHAKHDILTDELAAELHQLVALAQAACFRSALAEPGPESLREAIAGLLVRVPRYRTYFVDGRGDEAGRAFIESLVDQAQRDLRSRTTLDAVASLFLAPASSAAHAFVTRFQQVSGALLAKAQEDTAGFRWTRYLAANEVGAEPDEPAMSIDEANAFLAARKPTEMTLTSTHDTKRSEDSRMRLVAMSHHPEAFEVLVGHARQLSGADAVTPQWRWYIVQSALALWGATDGDLAARLKDHVLKAMREAKQVTYWTNPNAEIEGAACHFVEQLGQSWSTATPPELDILVTKTEALILAQTAVKIVMPGFPDFYRGTEGVLLALTDPDNRRPVDFKDLARLEQMQTVAGEKARLTRRLLGLRSENPAFFSSATSHISRDGDTLVLTRTHESRTLRLRFGKASAAPSDEQVWASDTGGMALTVDWLQKPQDLV